MLKSNCVIYCGFLPQGGGKGSLVPLFRLLLSNKSIICLNDSLSYLKSNDAISYCNVVHKKNSEDWKETSKQNLGWIYIIFYWQVTKDLQDQLDDLVSITTTRLATFLGVFSFTFSLISLPWNLLNNIGAFLSRCWSTLPCTYIGALLIINILGHRGRDIVANLLRNIITNLTRLIDIIANLVTRNNKIRKMHLNDQ